MPKSSLKFVSTVFDEYHTILHRYLVRRLRGRHLDAADVAQETYLRLLRMRNPESVIHPQAYVFRVASNVLREMCQKEQVQESLPERLTDPAAPGSASEVPESAVDCQIRLDALKTALSELPPRTQAIFILKKRDGLTRKEIAEQLKISEHTVKKHLLTAVAWCRNQGAPGSKQEAK